VKRKSLSAATIAIPAPRWLAVYFDDGLPFKVRTRAIRHLDLPQVASIAPQLHTHITAPSYTSIHSEILGVTVEIDKADRHHVHIVAVGAEAERPKGSISVPIF
jgi:hypothetical protein